jgi:hypothetical protein
VPFTGVVTDPHYSTPALPSSWWCDLGIDYEIYVEGARDDPECTAEWATEWLLQTHESTALVHPFDNPCPPINPYVNYTIHAHLYDVTDMMLFHVALDILPQPTVPHQCTTAPSTGPMGCRATLLLHVHSHTKHACLTQCRPDHLCTHTLLHTMQHPWMTWSLVRCAYALCNNRGDPTTVFAGLRIQCGCRAVSHAPGGLHTLERGRQEREERREE